jgi:hypothetical protein
VLQNLTYESFVEFVNQVFRVDCPTGLIELELIDCQKLNSHGQTVGRPEPFSLIFLGPTQPILSQRMYAFEFGKLGVLDIFIVPLGPDRSGKSGIRYEAIFA